MYTIVNYSHVLDAQDLSDLLKSAATRLMSNPYCTLPRFLQSFRDHELQEFVEKIGDPDAPNLKEPVLLTIMLTQAEGLDVDNETDYAIYVDYTIFIMVTESLRRKGLVKIDYSKISFDNAFNEKHYDRGITVIRPEELDNED